jgi:hypothetical protein
VVSGVEASSFGCFHSSKWGTQKFSSPTICLKLMTIFGGRFQVKNSNLIGRLRRINRRLLRATFKTYLWPCLSSIIPRLSLTASTFCQPFLITATVDFMGSPTTVESKKYGQALVGAYVRVCGITRRTPKRKPTTLHNPNTPFLSIKLLRKHINSNLLFFIFIIL